MNENQNMYEKEINLMELLIYCLKKWRWIVAAMLVIAVLAGGYKYVSIGKGNQAKIQQWNETKDEDEEEVVEEMTDSDVIQYYKRAIADSEKKLVEQQEYIDEALVMQIDPSNVNTGTLSFYLNVNEEENEANVLDVLLAAYKTYVNDGSLAEEIFKRDGEASIADLQYLLSCSASNGSITYIANGDSQWPKQNMIQVYLVAPDEDSCKTYMDAAESAILAYSSQLQGELPGHELRLLSSVQSVEQNSNIMEYQTKCLNDYTTALKNLRTLKTDLKTMIEEEEAALEAGETLEPEKTLVLDNQVTGGVKFAIVGIVLGAFLAAFVLILIYIMSSKIQSLETFEEEFGIKLLGRVNTPVGKGKWFGFLDRWIYRLEEGAYANIPYEEQAKIASANVKAAISKNEGLKKIMIAGTIAEKDAAELCAKLAEDVEGVSFSSYKQVVFSAAALEEMDDYDAVLFLEKRGVSASKMVREERELAVRRNVQVLGAVVM